MCEYCGCRGVPPIAELEGERRDFAAAIAVLDPESAKFTSGPARGGALDTVRAVVTTRK